MNKFSNSEFIHISSGDYSATLCPTGAALLQLTFRGEKYCPERDPATLVSSYHGSIIAPWPNRIRDGMYSFDGSTFNLPINEASRSNALHGFSASRNWQIQELSGSAASFGLELGPSSGYPWSVGLIVHYALSVNGLRLTFEAKLEQRQPFGWAFHPYFCLPGSGPEQWLLSHSAKSVMAVDQKRLLPISLGPVERLGLDFRAGKSPQIVGLDHGFTSLEFDDSGFTSVVLESESRRLVMAFDQASSWLQLHLPDSSLTSGPALVVEPMSLGPDAFNLLSDDELAQDGNFASTVRISISPK